ncbi:MAG: c-type cytochrome [Myxococcales bacterium]|nr:c-type cytochrome [Myxococcales bacterium]
MLIWPPAALLLATLTACAPPEEAPALASKALLGEALFHDVDLSWPRTQACATCHNPEHGFIDDRRGPDGRIGPVSLGADGASLGDRNAPTVAYAALAPPFQAAGARTRHHRQRQGRTYEGPLGGQFWDGRAPDLAGQAQGPPLNPLEMGMPDAAAVVARLQEKPAYVAAFRALFGPAVFADPDRAYAAFAESIAAFEQTEAFAPFDSRHDRALRGEITLSFKELTGKSLFFSQFTSCSACHQLHGSGDPVGRLREPFTGYEFHNVGVPVNAAVRAANGLGPDDGLAQNPATPAAAHRGRYKTPTLRNVAVTEPYMHNGVFQDLRTVIEFYDHQVDPEGRPLNPETGEPWAAPEVPDTVAHDLLALSDPLSDDQIEALVCFLRALTDQRWEHLVQDKGIACAD